VLRDSLANGVLEAVRKSTPTFFEELVIDLLVEMGYGGSVEDAGKQSDDPGMVVSTA
jgi:restriction system protein